MKKSSTILNRRSDHLLSVHAVVLAALTAAIAAPSPLRAENVKRRRAAKTRPPGSKPNRTIHEIRDELALEHPADHIPPPRATPEAERAGGRAVTLSVRELHILLRAAMPPGRTLRTRRAHVRLRDAMEHMADELAALQTARIPASLIRAQAGSIHVGQSANLVQFTPNWTLHTVWQNGVKIPPN